MTAAEPYGKTGGMKLSFTTAALAAAGLFTGLAAAWQTSVLMSANVWGHHFSQVEVKSTACVVTTTLEYTSPEQAYKSRLKGMNRYRFKARARFASGKVATSHVFVSTKPGGAKQSYTFDTTAEGCWAKLPQALRGVDVEGCRGEKCVVEPFK